LQMDLRVATLTLQRACAAHYDTCMGASLVGPAVCGPATVLPNWPFCPSACCRAATEKYDDRLLHNNGTIDFVSLMTKCLYYLLLLLLQHICQCERRRRRAAVVKNAAMSEHDTSSCWTTHFTDLKPKRQREKREREIERKKEKETEKKEEKRKISLAWLASPLCMWYKPHADSAVSGQLLPAEECVSRKTGSIYISLSFLFSVFRIREVRNLISAPLSLYC
jgi:hypothetical protein